MGNAPSKGEDHQPNTQQPQSATQAPAAVVAQGQPQVLPNGRPEKKPETKFLNIPADGWVAIFTGVLTVATILLWRATREAITDARKASERELRAYVMVKLKGASVDPTKNGHAWVRVHNRGQTPAHDTCVFWAFHINSEKPDRADIDQLNQQAKCPDDSALLIGPGEHRAVQGQCNPFTTEEASAVSADNARLYIVGRVEYVDAFDQKRTTRFCHVYSGPDLSKNRGRYGHYGNSAE